MKTIKLLCFSLFCLMACTLQAQRIAVVGFNAGANVSLADIDGISETFSTYFNPQGYTPVDRLNIDKALAEPTSIIAQINKQAQHGYNNWRIPTNEELSLMRANNYLGSGEYMTKESKHGIVLLVSDGEDYATLQAEEQARIKAEQEEQERKARLEAQSYVDLGLPSGTKWKDKNEEGGFYTYEEAVSKFGNKLPTKVQFEELLNSCTWSWTGSGYKVTGPNGQLITLPAAGYRGCGGDVDDVGSDGGYWSSTPYDSGDAWYLNDSDDAWDLYFGSGYHNVGYSRRCRGLSVRLVQD